MAINLQALKTELATAPYAGKSDEECAAMLAVRDRQANRETLDAGLLVASIVRSEYDALAPTAKDYLRLVAMAHTIPMTATLKAELGSIFLANTQTRANLLSLLKRPGTRAEELDLGGQPTTSDIANARRM